MNEFNLAKTFEEELLCHLCYDLLKDPRDLDCPHVFCLQCIKKLVGNSTTVECPECRHITFVPTEGMDVIKPNLRMRNMVEKLSCHNVIRENLKSRNAARCPRHSEEILNFKCDDCDVLVCQYCVVRSHQRHEIVECSDNGILDSKKLTFNRCQIDIGKLKVHLQHMVELEQAITKNCHLEESKIDRHVELVISDLQAKARLMKNRINRIKEKRLETIQEQIIVINDEIRKLEQKYVSTTDPSQDLDHVDRTEHNELMIETSKICSMSSNGLKQLTHADVRFQTRSTLMSPHCLHIGEIIYRRKLTLRSEFGVGSFQKAQGIAITKNGLIAVADSRADYVEVYRLEDSRYKRAFMLGASDDSTNGKITRPLDVAVNNDGKFLVVDSSLVKIYSNSGKYDRSFSTELHDNTCTADKSAPQGITTTRHGQNDVIVVADLGRQVITLHASSGSLLRLLKVDMDPRNRIATDGRQIFFTNYQEGKVCAIDFNSGDMLQQLDIPKVTAICCDEDSGSIILGRNDGTQGSGIIEQYCMTTGQLVARLASNLYAALGMAMTEDNKLIVADMISVKVYAIE